MNITEFATLAGVVIVKCDKSFGGRVGYVLKSNPNVTYCGYSSKSDAYSGWLTDTFDKTIAAAITELLLRSQKTEK